MASGWGAGSNTLSTASALFEEFHKGGRMEAWVVEMPGVGATGLGMFLDKAVAINKPGFTWVKEIPHSLPLL